MAKLRYLKSFCFGRKLFLYSLKLINCSRCEKVNDENLDQLGKQLAKLSSLQSLKLNFDEYLFSSLLKILLS